MYILDNLAGKTMLIQTFLFLKSRTANTNFIVRKFMISKLTSDGDLSGNGTLVDYSTL